MNIIYLRVSTNEDRQDLEQQKKAIIEKYGLKDYKVYMDEGSAYNQDKIKQRKDFLEIMELLFNASKTSIMDTYLNNYTKTNHVVYVWNYSRIMRHLEYNVLFYILAIQFNVTIISHSDNQLFDIKEGVTNLELSKRFLSLMNYAILSYSAEAYSNDTSKNISKSFIKGKGSSIYGVYLGSFKPGNNWKDYYSDTYTDLKGKERKRITPKGELSLLLTEYEELEKYVRKLLRNKLRGEVIDIIAKERGIMLSPAWLSRHFKSDSQ